MYAQRQARQPSYLQTGDDIDWGASNISDEDFNNYMEKKQVSLYKEDDKAPEVWKDAWNAPAYKTDDFHEEYSKYGLKFTGLLAGKPKDEMNDFQEIQHF